MPTFDFRCQKCDTVFEFARPFGSKIVPACPACKSKKTEKLLSAPGIVFKGEGWYKTDSRKSTNAPTTEKKNEATGKETKEVKDAKETKDTPSKETPKKSEKKV